MRKAADVAALVCSTLDKAGIDATIVGGTCVSIYSDGKYVSGDIDIVSFSGISEIGTVLKKIGFRLQSRKGRIFEKKGCEFFLDFVAPPLAVGNEPVKKTNIIKTPRGIIKLLTATDCVKDRLAAFFYYNDPQSLDQAIMVAKSNKIDIANIRKWAYNEGQQEKAEIFFKKCRRAE
jgi:hypothetical protein